MNGNFVHSDAEKNRILAEKDIVQFVTDRFSKVKKSKKIMELVEFQATNKYMIMAHNQEKLKTLGNLVASHKNIPLSEILNRYEEHLKVALNKKPTSKSHSNVLMHIFGYFAKNFSQSEKNLFFELLQQFREGQINISKILAEIDPLVYRFNNTYLAKQTYFLLYAHTKPGILFAVLNKDAQSIR